MAGVGSCLDNSMLIVVFQLGLTPVWMDSSPFIHTGVNPSSETTISIELSRHDPTPAIGKKLAVGPMMSFPNRVYERFVAFVGLRRGYAENPDEECSRTL